MGDDCTKSEKAITLGHPSYVWREGQERRFGLISQHAALEGLRGRQGFRRAC